MAFDPISLDEIEVGDALKRELFRKIKNDLDDLDERVQTLSGGSGKISLINEDVIVGSNGSSILTGALYLEVIQDCIVTEGAIQLFAKSPATTGSLTIDIKKNTTTNPSGFNSIFSVNPTLNVASASDYQRATGTIDPSAQALVVGDIIRLDITSLPAGLQRFRVVLIGEF